MLWLYIIVAIVVLLMVEKFIFPLMWIQGNSMYPTYKHNEFVFFRRVFFRKNLKKGDVIVACNPYSKDDKGKPKYVIKRIDLISRVNGIPSSVYILGDNSSDSYDSRHFGVLPIKCVYAKAIKSREKGKNNG